MAPKILLAEDNDSLAGLIETLLIRRGLTVERACDGHDALCRLAADRPAVLMLDLQLPKLSGVELLKKLRQAPKTKDLPVIIMSGVYRGERFAKAAEALGVRHYLEKPFGTEALLAALRQCLPEAPAGQPIYRHLQQALGRRFSGRCRLRNAGGAWNLFFVHGHPVALHPGFAHRDFGDFLQRRGILTAEEYAYLSAGGCEEAAIQMGCLGPAALLREKIDFLRHELVSAFTQPPLTVEAQAIQLPPEVQLATVSLPEIVLQGFRQFPDATGNRQLLDRRGRQYVAITPDFHRYIHFLPLTADEKQLTIRLNGRRTLLDSLAGAEQRLELIHTLDVLGMIRFAPTPLAAATVDFPQRPLAPVFTEEEVLPVAEEALESFADLVEVAGDFATLQPPAAASATATPAGSALETRVRDTLAGIEGKNYYEMFGLSQQNFSFDLLKERYFALTREFGPDILMQLGGEEAVMVEKILEAISAAYNTLSEVVKKERYDELLGADKIGLGRKGDDRFQAQVQFQSGKVFLDMEEWDSAEKALQDACNIEPQNGIYLAHLAWAIYRNPANANSRAVLDKARQMLNRSLTLERSAEAFAFKGQLLLEGGQENLAEIEFNKALRLNARLSLARAGLRRIQEKREQDSKGLFRRIFT